MFVSYFFISVICTLFLLLLKGVSDFNTWVTLAALVTFFHALSSTYTMKKACGTWLNLPMAFLFCLFLFNWGQLWLLGFFKNYEMMYDWNKISIYPSRIYTNTTVIIIMFITFVTLGIIAKMKKVISEKKGFSNQELKKIRYLGILVLIITLPFNIYENAMYIIASSIGGYKETFDLQIPDFVSVISWMSIIGAVACIIGTPKFKNILFLSFSAFYGFEMISGNRANSVVAILSILLFYNLVYPLKIGFRRLLIYGVLGFVLLTVLATIKVYRGSEERSIEGFNETAEVVTKKNIVLQNMEEFGGAIAFPSIVQIYLEQTGNYLYGWTFISSFAGIFPNITGDVADITNSGSMIHIIRDHIWGPYQTIAASCVSECVMNFGIFGVPFFAYILGLIIGYIHKKMEKRKNSWTVLFYVTFCYATIFWARNSFNSTVRSVVWGIILVWICSKIVGLRERKIHKHQLTPISLSNDDSLTTKM